MPIVFNNAGSTLYQLKIFAMTPSEYIMICGGAISSSGYSGRHPVAFWDTVLSGEAHYMHDGQIERASYRTGDRIFVGRWQSAAIHFPDHCWMLEYANGTLPLLPFGFAHIFWDTHDWVNAIRLIRVYSALSRRYFQAHPDVLQPIA